MQKVTLHFDSLTCLTTFSKMIPGGFVLDTRALSITGTFPTPHIAIATQVYDAKAI
ncbi:MAG TPA: hypothetical protein VEY10_10925 [Flavisolibacter sp.]|jgi:hypothetical protein|nr:hypothetical protein [Flavisolibacter sp.]